VGKVGARIVEGLVDGTCVVQVLGVVVAAMGQKKVPEAFWNPHPP
jgi:hypothetical protein